MDGFHPAANNADGGIIEKQTLSWLAEGDQPEAVIPLSASKRSRGIELWQQAGEQLGVLDAARNMMGSYATPPLKIAAAGNWQRL